MRTKHRCPKCDHGEVIHVPTPRDADQDVMALGGILSIWSGGVNAALEAYVCPACGYVELYLKSAEETDWKKVSGARVLRAVEHKEPPYR